MEHALKIGIGAGSVQQDDATSMQKTKKKSKNKKQTGRSGSTAETMETTYEVTKQHAANELHSTANGLSEILKAQLHIDNTTTVATAAAVAANGQANGHKVNGHNDDDDTEDEQQTVAQNGHHIPQTCEVNEQSNGDCVTTSSAVAEKKSNSKSHKQYENKHDEAKHCQTTTVATATITQANVNNDKESNGKDEDELKQKNICKNSSKTHSLSNAEQLNTADKKTCDVLTTIKTETTDAPTAEIAAAAGTITTTATTDIQSTAKSGTENAMLENTITTLTTEPAPALDLTNVHIEYKQYESELQMHDIMRLIQAELSEPYSIYTYRYFIYNWPKLCFLAAHGNEYVGAIVCKLDMHMNVRRGYIAMLAVRKEYRKLKIGTTLVQKAIEAMLADNADEVVLETEMRNVPALRLYENLGFVRAKRLFRYYLNGVDALRLKLWFR